MTKKELINEIKSVVMNNGGEVKHGQIRYFINENGDVMADHSTRRGKNVNYESKAQLEADLDVVKMLVEKYCNTEAKTVETKAENTENTVEVEPKATKKDIIMGLHKNDEVKCDLATAEELATDGFIYIRNYEDGVLYGEVDYDAVCEDLIDEDDLDLFNEVREGKFYHRDIDYVTDWCDMGYLSTIEYDCNGLWCCKVDWDGILTKFCKRWGSKLSEVA